jgi:uroporphyrinogen III methyltransferase/synthase
MGVAPKSIAADVAAPGHESLPLAGRTVLVPRPLGQAVAFSEALAALGAEPVAQPLTRIAPPDDPAPLAAALAALPSAYTWAAFTSANAVARTLEALAAAGRDPGRAFDGVRLAAVGEATAAALARRDLGPALAPARQDGAGLASAMAEADPAIDLATVLLPRAADGREELAAELARRGARVVSVAAYRTLPVPVADLVPLLGRLRRAEIDAIAFFAPSQVQALAAALGDDAAEVLGRARLIAAIGATTATALRERGLRVDLVPAAPTAGALALSIAEFLKEVR